MNIVTPLKLEWLKNALKGFDGIFKLHLSTWNWKFIC